MLEVYDKRHLCVFTKQFKIFRDGQVIWYQIRLGGLEIDSCCPHFSNNKLNLSTKINGHVYCPRAQKALA